MSVLILSASAGTVDLMDEPSASRTSQSEPTELLMLTSVVHHCADCGGDRLFVAVEIDLASDFACADCGAAVIIDPAFEYAGHSERHVA